MIMLYSLLCLAAAAHLCSSAKQHTPGERELRRDIFRDYDNHARPVKKQTTAVPVNISLSLLGVKYLSEKSQLISLETWLKLRWMDEYLTWNPAEYNNITLIHVSPSQVWRPDIAVYTASPDSSLFPKVQTDILLYSNGILQWVPPFTINSRCPRPHKGYVTPARPFIDCYIRMGSWTHSGKMLDLQLDDDKVQLSNFQDFNYGWKLVKATPNRESKLYPCCTDEYPVVNFHITLKKRNYYLTPENGE